VKRTGPNVVARFETFILFSALASATLNTNNVHDIETITSDDTNLTEIKPVHSH